MKEQGKQYLLFLIIFSIIALVPLQGAFAGGAEVMFGVG